MERKIEKILDIPVDLLTMDDIVVDLEKSVESEGKLTLTSINPQIILESQKNKAVKTFLINSTHKFPDGIGVIKVSGWTKGLIKERIAGIDVMDEVLKFSEKNKQGVYFYGAKPEVLKQAVTNIQKNHSQLIVSGFTDGYTSTDEKKLIKEINNSGAKVLFVALGSPRQEEWLHRNMAYLDCKIFQTIGGSLDVKSGYSKRAPDLWIKLNLEWVYRSFSNPKRLNRIFQVPVFIAKSLVWHSKHKRELRGN